MGLYSVALTNLYLHRPVTSIRYVYPRAAESSSTASARHRGDSPFLFNCQPVLKADAEGVSLAQFCVALSADLGIDPFNELALRVSGVVPTIRRVARTSQGVGNLGFSRVWIVLCYTPTYYEYLRL